MKKEIKKKARSKWDVSHIVNPNGSVNVFSMVNNGIDCWLRSKTFYFYNVKEARLTFIEEALNEGLKLESI